MLFSSDVDAATLADLQHLIDTASSSSSRGNKGRNKVTVNLLDDNNNSSTSNKNNDNIDINSQCSSNLYLAVPTNLEGKRDQYDCYVIRPINFVILLTLLLMFPRYLTNLCNLCIMYMAIKRLTNLCFMLLGYLFCYSLLGKLLQLLDITPFSTSVKVRVKDNGGDLSGEDIRRRVDPLQPLPPRYVNKVSKQFIGDSWGRLYN